MDTIAISTAYPSTTWNGGVCPTCQARYVGWHACDAADLRRLAARLIERAEQIESQPRAVPVDPTRSCPCRPENGGSGVCGCIMGGPQVTC